MRLKKTLQQMVAKKNENPILIPSSPSWKDPTLESNHESAHFLIPSLACFCSGPGLFLCHPRKLISLMEPQNRNEVVVRT